MTDIMTKLRAEPQIFEIDHIRERARTTDNPLLRLNLELALQMADGMRDPVFIKEGTALRVSERVQ